MNLARKCLKSLLSITHCHSDVIQNYFQTRNSLCSWWHILQEDHEKYSEMLSSYNAKHYKHVTCICKTDGKDLVLSGWG